MESNGKRVTRDGEPAPRATAVAVFGDAGTNGQHAFFQLLHQGTDVIPVDIVLAAAGEGAPDLHRKLLANGIAQSEALMVGRSETAVREELEAAGLDGAEIDALAPQRAFPGDRPTTTIVLPRVDGFSLGALLAWKACCGGATASTNGAWSSARPSPPACWPSWRAARPASTTRRRRRWSDVSRIVRTQA